MSKERLIQESVLRIGEVSAVTGRRVSVTVDKEKNLSELFFDGDILRNVAVGSYIDIRKGFVSLIGKVEGEETRPLSHPIRVTTDIPFSQRIITIVLVGYLDKSGSFYGGTKELPLLGNEAFLLTKEKIHQIHNLIGINGLGLKIAKTDYEGYELALPIDGLMNSHIAIFGNTGSGKSNTLAAIFHNFISEMRRLNEHRFDQKCRVIIFDFNGEYTSENCIATKKKVYNLSTYHDEGDKIPLDREGLLDLETLCILSDATEKTQKPFLSRCLRLYHRVMSGEDSLAHTKNILRQQIQQVLQMSDKVRADLLLDYFRQILPETDQYGAPLEIAKDLDWNNTHKEFMWQGYYLKSNPAQIVNTLIYQTVECSGLMQPDT